MMKRSNSLAYAAVLVASLLSAALQPGRAEAPAHSDALLALASWADDAVPSLPVTPASQAPAPQPKH